MHTPAPSSRVVKVALLVCSLTAVLAASSPAAAQDQIYFPATDNTINTIVNYINNETVRIDISAWYLTEHAISIAIANRFQAGVPVRLIGDKGAIFEIDPNTKAEFYWLANYGVPIRLRVNPTWYPEIDHWKFAYFKGQKTVEFGSANWVTFELAPSSSTNFDDETVMFTSDPVLVGAFATKFDQIWNDTTNEPESIYGGPPYLMNWYDACTLLGCDFLTQYPNPAPMNVNTARLEPNNAMPADLIWGQGPDFNNRLVTEINNESSSLAFVIYRLTVDNITQALLAKRAAGLPMQVIIEPNEYRNRKWPEFWLTHANVDKLWSAGVPLKWRTHQGMTHMKTLVTSTYATNASSNYAAGWQRDHDYFVSASAKPTIYTAIKNRVQAMWNDAANFTTFSPEPPDAAVQESPASGATGVATTPTLTWDRAAFATSYDIYLGPAGSGMTRVANVPAVLTPTPPTTYSWTPSTSLATGTTYNWQVVSRTFATDRNSSITAVSPVWSFTTSGTPGGGGGGGGALPSPWVSQDVGSVGTAGSSSYSNGVFTVSGSGTIWGSADGMQFAYQPISGDTTIIARVTAVQNTSTYAKAGIMIRDTTAANGAHVILDLRPTGDIEFMTRPSDGAATTFIAGAFQSAPAWLKLVRSGTTVTGYVSSNGSTWTTVGSTTLNISSSALAGMAVCSVTSGLNSSTFDNVSVAAGGTPPPPPPPTASNIVIYASDVPSSGLHGHWSAASAAGSPNSIKLVTPDNGTTNTNNALASPSDYVDVTFNAVAGTPYRFWMRLQAAANSKYNDSVWVQFSGANNYAIGTTSGLLVNLATDGTGSSLSGWGWQNSAYWLSQPTTITFNTTGTQTVRVQVREDGVQFDQIVLSPTTYYNSAPGPVSNDNTIVPK